MEHNNDILDFLDNLDCNYLIEYDDREKILNCLHICGILNYKNKAHDITFYIACFKFKIWKNETDYHVTVIDKLKHSVTEILNDNLDKIIEELAEVFKCAKEDFYKKLKTMPGDINNFIDWV